MISRASRIIGGAFLTDSHHPRLDNKALVECFSHAVRQDDLVIEIGPPKLNLNSIRSLSFNQQSHVSAKRMTSLRATMGSNAPCQSVFVNVSSKWSISKTEWALR